MLERREPARLARLGEDLLHLAILICETKMSSSENNHDSTRMIVEA